MSITQRKLFPAAAIAIAALFLFFAFFPSARSEVDSQRCNVSTISGAQVGNQLSRQILATTTNRAFTRIEQVRTSDGTATSTVHVAFNGDLPATSGTGLTLSTTTPYIDFGLNTDFPYQGAVQGLTSTGSTTVRITECVY